MQQLAANGLTIERYALKKNGRMQKVDRALFLKKKEEFYGYLLDFAIKGGDMGEAARSIKNVALLQDPKTPEATKRRLLEKAVRDILSKFHEDKARSHGYEVFLAYHGELLVGVFTLSYGVVDVMPTPLEERMKAHFPDFDTAKGLLLRDFSVRFDYRNCAKGIRVGTALVQTARDAAREQGRFVFGFAAPYNKNAMEFYRRRGAKVVEAEIDNLGCPFVFP